MRNKTSLERWKSSAAVVGRFLPPLGHPVVADDPGDAEPIVLEYATASSLLCSAMANVIAPPRHGFCVAPKLQRQQLAGIGQALESLDRDEALDLFQLRAQPSRMVEIGFAFAIGRPYLEDHRDHRVPPISVWIKLSPAHQQIGRRSRRYASPLPAEPGFSPGSMGPHTATRRQAMRGDSSNGCARAMRVRHRRHLRAGKARNQRLALKMSDGV